MVTKQPAKLWSGNWPEGSNLSASSNLTGEVA